MLEEEHPFLRQEQERRQEERSFLLERIDDLEATIKKLQDQLSLNSQNSSQPPSTDQSRKTKSLRKRSGRSADGQPGHEGHHLAFKENPDHLKTHAPEIRAECGGSLSQEGVAATLRRQAFEFPPLELEVAEHQVEQKVYPCRHHLDEPLLPVDVKAPTQ